MWIVILYRWGTKSPQTLPHHTIWCMKKGTGKGASVPENILKYLFLPLCLAPSPSMTSLQQTLEPSSHIYIFFYYSPSRVSMQSQPPSLSLPISSKSFLSHIPPSVPPSILLLLFYPLLPSIFQSHSTWQSNSCPLTSPITVYQWLFPVW